MRYPHLWARLYNTPLLVHPDKAAIIERVLRSHEMGDEAAVAQEDSHKRRELELERAELKRLGLEHQAEDVTAVQDEHRAVMYQAVRFQKRSDKPYLLTDSGLAVIPILGTLIQRGGWMDAMSGMTSYGSIEGQLVEAMADPEVKGILLEVDSFGGEANGMFDLADAIFAARADKPIWSHLNEQAYSAAYGLASAAEQIYLPRSGGLGSIGVIMLHVDQSVRDAKQGYTYTFIHAGARKKDFNSHEPLSSRARQTAQAEVDRLYGMFVDSVARNRSVSADAVRATEAGIMSPDAAIEGRVFADGIATFGQTIKLLEQEVAKRSSPRGSGWSFTQENQPMSKEGQQPAAGSEALFTRADVDQAKATGKTEGLAEGRKTERERIRAIVEDKEAVDRQKAAFELALGSDVDVATASKILASLPKDAKAKDGGFSNAMRELGNPKVGADAGEVVDVNAQREPNTVVIYATRAKAAAEARR